MTIVSTKKIDKLIIEIKILLGDGGEGAGGSTSLRCLLLHQSDQQTNKIITRVTPANKQKSHQSDQQTNIQDQIGLVKSTGYKKNRVFGPGNSGQLRAVIAYHFTRVTSTQT